MNLVSVYLCGGAKAFLYDLLKERKPHQNISHKGMPSWDAHCKFVDSEPYQEWYLIEDQGIVVGSIYLTRQREVGIFIFERYQGKGYGSTALSLLEAAHPGKLLANVSPTNQDSMSFFMGRGFKLVQFTLIKEEEGAGTIH